LGWVGGKALVSVSSILLPLVFLAFIFMVLSTLGVRPCMCSMPTRTLLTAP